MKAIVFDTEALKLADEVGGFKNARKMGISVIGAWRSDTARYKIWRGDAMDEFIDWVNWCDTIVGYNHIDYDMKVLSAYLDIKVLLSKQNIDMIKIVKAATGRFVALDKIAYDTIGIGKTEGYSGKMAPILWREGKYLELFQYLLDDLQVSVKLFYHILKERSIMHDGKNYEVEDLKIEVNNLMERQLELF